MTTERQFTPQEKTLQGASVAEVVRAYDEGLISVTGVRLLLGVSDRHARSTLCESGVHIRTRAEEVYARRSRESAGNGSSPQTAPAVDVTEQLYRDHLAGNITQVEAARRLGITQQNFSLRLLRWRVKQLEAENAQLKRQLQQPPGDEQRKPEPARGTQPKAARPRKRTSIPLVLM